MTSYATEDNKIIGGKYAGMFCETINAPIKPLSKKICNAIKELSERMEGKITPITFSKYGYYCYSTEYYEVDPNTHNLFLKEKISPKMLSDEDVKEMIGIEKLEREMKRHQESSELSEAEILATLREWDDMADRYLASLDRQKEQIIDNMVNREFSTMIYRKKERDRIKKELDREQKEIDKMLEDRDSTRRTSRNRKRRY